MLLDRELRMPEFVFHHPEHLKMRRRPAWVWWNVPNTNCCSHLMFSMRRRVSPKKRASLWSPWLQSPALAYRKGVWRGDILSKHFLSSIGEFVAQFKFTVLLMPNGPMRITSGPFEPDLYKSEMEVQDAELKVSVWRKGVNTLHMSWEWGGGVSKVLQRAGILRHFVFPQHSSKFVFLPPPIFQALLQSSASRKTQKKKKKKVWLSVSGRVNLIPLESTFLGVVVGIYVSVYPYFPFPQPWPRALGYFCPWYPGYYPR